MCDLLRTRSIPERLRRCVHDKALYKSTFTFTFTYSGGLGWRSYGGGLADPS